MKSESLHTKGTKSLSQKMLVPFVGCIIGLLLLATPLFYFLTRWFYAEDLIRVIEVVGRDHPLPSVDLEEDIMQGIMLQFGVISLVLAVSIVLTLRFIARRLWRPFDETLRSIENFRLEDGRLPDLPTSRVAEFARLNRALQTLMRNSLNSYRLQKEFTENASHELQTPLAVFRSKLDLLLQRPDLTGPQAAMIQDLYQVSSRLTRLNRNLLLLARIENSQYGQTEEVDLVGLLDELLPSLESLAGNLTLHRDFRVRTLTVRANRTLLESLVNNLVVNAVRHNRPGGEITVTVAAGSLTVSNTSDGKALDARLLFNRFYRPSEQVKGNGLGLAIVKAICQYHGWKVSYSYTGRHCFTVDFS